MAKKRMTLEERNAAFEAMSVAKQRVEIAKDALAQIRAEHFTAGSGYVCFTSAPENFDSEKSLQPFLLSRNPPKCEGCAKAALLLSTIRKRNQLSVGDAEACDGETLHESFSDLWTEHQSDLVEWFYEGWIDQGNASNNQREVFLANYQPVYRDDRLVRILENIIDNNGTFKPEKEKIQVEA